MNTKAKHVHVDMFVKPVVMALGTVITLALEQMLVQQFERDGHIIVLRSEWFGDERETGE